MPPPPGDAPATAVCARRGQHGEPRPEAAAAKCGNTGSRRGGRSAHRRIERRRERNRRGRLRGRIRRLARRAPSPDPVSDPPGGAGGREAHRDRAPAVPSRVLRLATYNCRTLKPPWRRGLLAQLAQNLRLDIVLLQEVSIAADPGLHQDDLGAGWTLFYTTADSRGRGGVGALVGPRLRQSVCCVSLSPRLLRVDVRLQGRNARLFGAYAPTAAHPQEAREFFDFLSEQLESVASRDTLVVCGDLNAVLRRSDRSPFVSPRPNANTDALTDFLGRHDLVSANTRLRKPPGSLSTFTGCKRRRRNACGPNATRRLAQLDHVLLRHRERGRVTNCDTVTPLAVKSDHRLLLCELRLKDPLYRPPKRPRRRYFRALRDLRTAWRFSRAFAAALGDAEDADYAAISTAIRAAAEKSLPLMQPAHRALPVWANDAEVATARRQVESLRRRRRPTAEAEKVLADTYAKRQEAAVDEAVRSVMGAGPDAKHRLVWPAINALTGRKRRTALNLVGDSAEARRNELRDFFAEIVNAPPPTHPPSDIQLPPGVPLPPQEAFSTRCITASDVVRFAEKTSGGKATGPDEVPVEALRVPRVATEVARVMNSVLDGGAAPPEWTVAHIVGIPKKPGTTRKEEHRGICLMSCAAKLFNRVLLARLQPVLDPFLRCEQNGFRPSRGTVTQILALRRSIEIARIHQSSLVCIFVDFRKAFDSVSRPALPFVLREYNVPQPLISAVMAMYQNTQAAVLTPDGPSDLFRTTSGVLQGDTLAPFLFTLVVDWVLRVGLPSSDDGFVLCRRTSRRHPERRLSVLAYADDIALLSASAEGAQRLLDGLSATAARVGLSVSTKKTEVLTVPADLAATIVCREADGAETTLSRCSSFVYLGGMVPSVASDIRRRRGLAWAALRSVRAVLCSAALPDSSRSRLFQAVVETVMLYNAETWTLTESLERQLDAAHAALLRAAFSIRPGPDGVSNAALYRRAQLLRPSALLKLRRLRLVGHVVRAAAHCPEPLQEVLLLTQTGFRRRRGQGRSRTFVDCLLQDANAPDLAHGAEFVRDLATRRVI